MKKYNVISVGSGLVDAFFYTEAKEKEGKICFPVGTKITVDKIKFSIGGGGINTSMCLSNIGLKAGFLGKIGRGYNSKIILRELKRNNVNFLGKESKEHAGYSVVLETDKNHRTILTYKGASDNLSYEEIDLKKLNCDWFHFTSMSGESFKSQKKIALFAKRNKIRLSFNPSSYQIKYGVDYLRPILKYTDFLSLNKEEAHSLVGKADPHKKLHNLGPKIVCITDGGKGGCVSDGIYKYNFAAKKVKVREKTGAGDVFASSFIAGIIKSSDLEIAIKSAILNSAHFISTSKPKTGFLKWSEIEKRIKNESIRIKREEF